MSISTSANRETPKKDYATNPKKRASIRRNLAVMTGYARAVRNRDWEPIVCKGGSLGEGDKATIDFPYLYADTRFYRSRNFKYAGESPTSWESLGHHTKLPLLCYGLLSLPDDRQWWLFSTHLGDDTVELLKQEASPAACLGRRLHASFSRAGCEIDYVLRLEMSQLNRRPHVHGFLRAFDEKSKKNRRLVKERLNVAMGEWATPASSIYQSHVPSPVSGAKWARYITKEPAISRMNLRLRFDISAPTLIAASNSVRSHSRVLWDDMHEFSFDWVRTAGL